VQRQVPWERPARSSRRAGNRWAYCAHNTSNAFGTGNDADSTAMPQYHLPAAALPVSSSWGLGLAG
jgi:hypothetical protein